MGGLALERRGMLLSSQLEFGVLYLAADAQQLIARTGGGKLQRDAFMVPLPRGEKEGGNDQRDEARLCVYFCDTAT